MKAWSIDARANSPKNSDPQIVTPIETESVALPENPPHLAVDDHAPNNGYVVDSGKMMVNRIMSVATDLYRVRTVL
jgi:hypothetical protein